MASLLVVLTFVCIAPLGAFAEGPEDTIGGVSPQRFSQCCPKCSTKDTCVVANAVEMWPEYTYYYVTMWGRMICTNPECGYEWIDALYQIPNQTTRTKQNQANKTTT